MTVIDASALAGWLLPDEDGPDLGDLISQGDALAPWLLWVELRNILLVVERRGRIDPGETTEILEAIGDIGILLKTDFETARVMALCRRHGLTAYDSLYLDLAIREGTSLASLDKSLVAAAKAEGIEIV